MDKPKRRPSINDIASAAGVSKTTVSRYINGHYELMSEATRERIKTIIDLSNYQPSEIARSLKLKRNNLIGVIVAEMGIPFSTALIASISESLKGTGYFPLIMGSRGCLQDEEQAIELMRMKEVSGFLINTTSFNNPKLISLACNGVPIVLCDQSVKDYNFNVVSFDNIGAICTTINHLKAQGYTRPFFFTKPWENHSTRMQRREGFITSVEKIFGYNPSNDVYVYDVMGGQSIDEQVGTLINSLRDGDIPAVIGFNSETTVLIYKALKRHGMKIPEDIGICGPDDWDWRSNVNWPSMVEPAITTYSIPTEEMGKQAVSLLLEIMNNPQQHAKTIVLPSELQAQTSTIGSRVFKK